jgi:hypothetical protein
VLLEPEEWQALYCAIHRVAQLPLRIYEGCRGIVREAVTMIRKASVLDLQIINNILFLKNLLD